MQHQSGPSLIGSSIKSGSLESFHIYLARMLYANFLDEKEIHRRIPLSWLQLAFAPQNANHDLLDMAAKEAPFPVSLSAPQTLSGEWEVFPILESHPNEYMRFCPACFENGHHSYAFQSTLLKQCPIHQVQLTDRCPTCGTPMPWKSHRLYSISALRCPRGCDLAGRYLNGLIDPPEGWEFALKDHFDWTQRTKHAIQFALSPIYIAYPARQLLDGLLPYRPSEGLTAAFCDALRPIIAEMPTFLPFHNRSHGKWEMQLSDAPEVTPIDQEKIPHEDLAQSIQRGPYTTDLPILSSSDSRIALNHLASETTDYPAHRIRQSEQWMLTVPSYLVTNSEVAALYQVLTADAAPEVCRSLYDRLLLELLDGAYERRRAFDEHENLSCLDVAERVDGLVTVRGRNYRITGMTKSSISGKEAWESFTEQTAPRAGTVAFATARGVGI